MLLMELHEGIQIHGAHAVAVRHHKWLIADIRLNPFDSSASHRIQACIYQCHLPWLRIVIMNFHLIIGKIKGHIRCVKEIVRKKFLHHILFISEAYHKIMKTEFGIIFHNMP